MEDLFAPLAAQRLTVTQVNSRARILLERHFSSVNVVGEISGHKIVGGHHYFCLKDKESQLSAVLFRREALQQELELADGIEVVVAGRLTIYGAQGRYQIVVERMQRVGAGALQAAFEQLKARLAAEGLFDADRKRRLPLLPRRVAVVTSPTGAVIRDIVHIAARRWPNASILVVPTRVQGAESALQVAQAIRKASALASRFGLDVMIVARGGGSLEDLWCFNDEGVARALHASSIPVVSAVGHETDFTIADFVADVRAPTPSAAAELVFPVHSELHAGLRVALGRARAGLERELRGGRMHLRALRAELGDARRRLREEVQRLGHLQARNEEALRSLVLVRRLRLRQLESRLARLHPSVHLRDLRAAKTAAERRILLLRRQAVTVRGERLVHVVDRIHALSPRAVLERGYAIVQSAGGAVVRRAGDVIPGEQVRIHLSEGQLEATIDPARARERPKSGSTSPPTRDIKHDDD